MFCRSGSAKWGNKAPAGQTSGCLPPAGEYRNSRVKAATIIHLPVHTKGWGIPASYTSREDSNRTIYQMFYWFHSDLGTTCSVLFQVKGKSDDMHINSKCYYYCVGSCYPPVCTVTLCLQQWWCGSEVKGQLLVNPPKERDSHCESCSSDRQTDRRGFCSLTFLIMMSEFASCLSQLSFPKAKLLLMSSSQENISDWYHSLSATIRWEWHSRGAHAQVRGSTLECDSWPGRGPFQQDHQLTFTRTFTTLLEPEKKEKTCSWAMWMFCFKLDLSWNYFEFSWFHGMKLENELPCLCCLFQQAAVQDWSTGEWHADIRPSRGPITTTASATLCSPPLSEPDVVCFHSHTSNPAVLRFQPLGGAARWALEFTQGVAAAAYASMVAAFSLYCSSKAWTLRSFAAYDSANVNIIYAHLHHYYEEHFSLPLACAVDWGHKETVVMATVPQYTHTNRNRR